MKLRTQIALSGLMTAVIVCAILIVFMATAHHRTLDRYDQLLTNSVVGLVEEAIKDKKETLDRSLRGVENHLLSEGETLMRVFSGGVPEDPTALREPMQTAGLTFLCLTDIEGKILLSGHRPATYGRPFPAVTDLPVSRPVFLELEMQGTGVWFLEKRKMRIGRRKIFLIGGVPWSESTLSGLAEISGTALAIRKREKILLATRPDFPPANEQDISRIGRLWRFLISGSDTVSWTVRDIPVSDQTSLIVGISRGPHANFVRTLVWSLLSAAGLGILLSWLLARVTARASTRSIESLVEMTEIMGGGARAEALPEAGTDEVRHLVESFNRMSAELSRVQEELIRAERMAAWREAARRLAHEIKNPLSPIQISLANLAKAKGMNPEVFHRTFEESLGSIRASVEGIRRVVEEFSRFARLPAPRKKPVDPAAVCRTAVDLIRQEAPEHRWEFFAPEDLPPVSLDEDLIHQVLINLLNNAVQALREPGTIRIKCAIREGEEGTRLRILVEDSGPGIEEPDPERIFEPYFTTRSTGTGLGLALSRRIAQDHGGSLSVGKSALGGAAFLLQLPLE